MRPELWEVVLLDEMDREESLGGSDGGCAGCLGCAVLVAVLFALLGLVGQCVGPT